MGLAFLLIFYSHRDEFYYMPFTDLERFWRRAQEGGRKSVRFEEIDTQLRIWPNRHGILLPYLDAVAMDLERHDWAQA
jgi:recombination protein U